MTSGQNSLATHSFLLSPHSTLVRQHRRQWQRLLVSLAGYLLYLWFPTPSLLILPSALLLLLWHRHVTTRKKLASNEPWLRLDAEGLYSPWLFDETKHYQWTDIRDIRIRRFLFRPCLWFSTQDETHMLSLDGLDEASQQQLQQVLPSYHPGQAPLPDVLPAPDAPADPIPLAKACVSLLLLHTVWWLVTVAAGADMGLSLAGDDGATPKQLLDWGGNTASEVQHGAWWRLLSAIMLHGSLPHLLMNMAGLCSMGILAERLYGPPRFLLLYLGSGLCGNALSLHFGAQSAISAGASGAIFGIAGALLMTMLLRTQPSDSLRKQKLSTLGLFVFYALLVGVTSKGVDNAAHIGGLLGGMLLAPILLPGQRFSVHPLLAGVATMAVVSALAVTAPQAPADMRYLITSQDIRERVDKQQERQTTLLQQDEEAARNGKLDKHAFDQRRRDIHAPVFARLHRELAAYPLSDDDPLYYRQKIKLRRLRLQGELLQIPLATAPSADMQNRASEIERELADLAVSERVMQAMETLHHHLYRRQAP